MSVRVLLLLMVFHAPSALAAEADPLQSVMWEYHHKGLLNSEPYVFDERVKVQVPPFAEDSRQVPVHIDARALGDEVVRIEAWADLNPIPRIFTFTPGEQVVPLVAIRIRVEQATPIRAAVLTRDGVWHIGSASFQRSPRCGGGIEQLHASTIEAGEIHLIQGKVHQGAIGFCLLQEAFIAKVAGVILQSLGEISRSLS